MSHWSQFVALKLINFITTGCLTLTGSSNTNILYFYTLLRRTVWVDTANNN